MSNSVRPHRQQPTRLPRPWDSPGKNTGVGCHFLLQCMKVKSEREVAQSCLTLSVYHEILLCHLRKWNNTIWSDMDGPGDCHTKWSKTERYKYCTLWLICVILKKKWYKWTYLQNRNSHRYRKQPCGYQQGEDIRGKLGDRDQHIHTTIYKTDNW